MSRHLFRVWDQKEQRYSYFSQPDNTIYRQVWIKLEGGLSSVKHQNPRLDQMILEQSIGLKDKYKMLIYEADILKVDFNDQSLYWEVVWKDAAFKLQRYCKKTNKIIEKYIKPHMVARWEVIGTKHLMGRLMEL